MRADDRALEPDLVVALPGEVLVLSAQDFDAALARATAKEGKGGEPVVMATAAPTAKRRLAASIAALANNSNALGVSTQSAEKQTTFEGSVFLVADDLVVEPRSGQLQATSYRVAAITLKGYASIVGRGLSLRFTGPVGGETGRCCGPASICVPTGVSPDPAPPCEFSMCGGENVGVSTHAPPTSGGRPNAGLPQVPLTVYGGAPGTGALGGFELDCTSVRDPMCDRVIPVCDFGDTGFTENEDGGGDAGSGSNPCAPGRGSPAMGRDVPEFCLYVSGWDALPPECGGWCEDCQSPPSSRHELPPGCAVARTTADSDVCQPKTPEREALEQAARRLAAGWIPGQASTTCSPLERGGVEVCTTCDASGNCGEFVRRSPVNPVAEDGGECGENGCDEYGKRINPDNWWKYDGGYPEPEPVPDVEPITPVPGGRANDPAPGDSNDPGHTPSPDPDPPISTDHGHGSDPFVQKPEQKGDPISLGNGGFRLAQQDLSFDGPVRPLGLRRYYDSTSTERTSLGSNWRHQWDVCVAPVDEDTAPSWLSPYSLGSPETPTCVVLHEADGSMAFFHLDLDTRLFVPQAGSFETLSRLGAGGGWALRAPDGAIRYFDEFGCLTADRDRFGNGFRLEYESTPLFELYQYFCSPAALAERNETKYAARSAVLAYLVGEGSEPAPGDAAWGVSAADLSLPASLATTDPALAVRLTYARAYLVHLARLGYGVQPAHGMQRRRVTRVTDDLGRRIVFTYRTAPALPGRAGQYDFAGTPDAGLLLEVLGPVNTRVRFRYDRPSAYPAALNEMFLVGVDRDDQANAIDVASAVPWSCTFTYQWPGVLSADYEQYRSRVNTTWLNYYRTFVGCAYQDLVPCSMGAAAVIAGTRFALGDPAALATKAELAYVSAIADNIVTVVRNGVVESETRFGIDPWRDDFDHAIAQRYGSSTATAPPVQLKKDDPAHEWSTDLPRVTFAYCDAGPRAGRDKTDAFLPATLRTRYPLETAPPADSTSGPTPVVSTTAKGAFHTCDYDEMRVQEQWLPHHRETVDYYRPIEAERHPSLARRLFRTRLTPAQLAGAQLGDPAHNDLISRIEPDATSADPDARVVERLVGRRSWIAANANRLCRWVQFVNRDGDLTYFGLNYRGQVLVEAIREREGKALVIAERLYNADGNLVQERRPTRGAAPWTESAGYAAYEYDEINPEGANGWNAWLPVFWSRRGNRLRLVEWASGLGVLNRDEHSEQLTTAVGRYTRWRHEPLFNQIYTVTHGALVLQAPATRLPPGRDVLDRAPSLALRPVEQAHTRILNTFDYQELSWDVPASDPASIRPVLEALEPWGFFWFRDAAGALDPQRIGSWQLPVPLFATDINGDGFLGFDREPGNARRARGVPIATRVGGPLRSVDDVTTFFTWAPHGKLAGTRGPDGDVTTFEYYTVAASARRQARYGSALRPGDRAVDANYRGFLGRMRTRRYPSTYPSTLGPPEAPCPALPGPYQWLLPHHVISEPGKALGLAGFPQDVVNAILGSAGASEEWSTRSFSYNDAGGVRYAWDDHGTSHTVRDIDGRPTLHTDARQRATRTEYTADGQARLEIATNAAGDWVGEIFREFDETGAMTYECRARSLGGAKPYGSPRPADGSVMRWSYYPDGAVARSVDPLGATLDFRYDERGRMVHERATAPGFGRPRGTSYRYTVDGDLASVTQGDPDGDGRGLSGERFSHDGLRRLVTRIDPRGFAWQVAYSARDLRVALRRSDAPYGTVAPAPTWERTWRYDVAARQTEERVNGILVERRALSAGGRVHRRSADGIATTYVTYDSEGNVVWTREPNGVESITVRRLHPRQELRVTLRGTGGDRHVEIEAHDLDAAGDLAGKRVASGGVELRTVLRRDHDGRLVAVQQPDGGEQEWSFNWLGWPTSHRVLREMGGTQWDRSTWEYNARGQVTAVVDPAGQRTELSYDPLGSLTSWRAPGWMELFRHDDLGRVVWSMRGSVEVQQEWDASDHPVGELVNEQGTWQRLTRRTYDDLGRLQRCEATNYALSWLVPDERLCVTTYEWDALDRLQRHTVRWGRGPRRELRASWTLASDTWERTSHYTAGNATAEWIDTYDGAGRHVRKSAVTGGRWSNSTEFQWNNDLYAGRIQQVGARSPFREERFFDEFSRLSRLRYRAIDVDAQQAPVDAAEGQAYCGGAWRSAVCGAPLLDIDIRRELLGRVASLQWAFGHPAFRQNALVTAPRRAPWRGYAYTPRRALKGVWEHDGAPTGVDLGTIVPYRVTEAELAQVGTTASYWEYQREGPVGGTVAIAQAGRGSRWRLPVSRASGHRLQEVEIDGTGFVVQHAPSGRIAHVGSRGFGYDAEGRLALVTSAGILLEAYGYDATGRLAAVIPASGTATTFLHDGEQIVTASQDDTGALEWEAVWGPELDALVSWRSPHVAGEIIPLRDHAGSVVGAWNARTSRMVETAVYTAEGTKAVSDPAGRLVCADREHNTVCAPPAQLPFGFTGAFQSHATGLLYLRNRWYSPALGQFMSVDPLGFQDGYNAYAYGRWDPVNRRDPFGLDSGGASDPVRTDLPPQKHGGGKGPKPVKKKPDPKGPPEDGTVEMTLRMGPLVLRKPGDPPLPMPEPDDTWEVIGRWRVPADGGPSAPQIGEALERRLGRDGGWEVDEAAEQLEQSTGRRDPPRVIPLRPSGQAQGRDGGTAGVPPKTSRMTHGVPQVTYVAPGQAPGRKSTTPDAGTPDAGR